MHIPLVILQRKKAIFYVAKDICYFTICNKQPYTFNQVEIKLVFNVELILCTDLKQ